MRKHITKVKINFNFNCARQFVSLFVGSAADGVSQKKRNKCDF